MKVYIDLLFLLNFIYDFFLLMTVSITLKRNIKIKRLLIGSLFGALSSLIIIVKMNKYLLFLMKIVMGLLMEIITFKYKNFKYTFNNTIYLYMSSVILAGFLYFLKIEFHNLSYFLILLIGPLILYLYIKENNYSKKICQLYKKVTITFKNNQKIIVNGFIDTGNRLKDPITNKYIILLNKNILKGIYNIRSPIYVPVKSINKCSLIECISIKNIEIENKEYSNYLIGFTNRINNEDFDCLLNYYILEE